MSLPSSEPAKRVAAIMHRRLTTHWSELEIRFFRKLVKSKCFDSEEDMVLVERYYAFERRRGDRGLHRRDLITLLRNWQGELDRATLWSEQHPLKTPPRKIIPMEIPSEPWTPPTDPEEIARHERFMAELNRRKSKPLTAFQEVKRTMEAK